MNINKLKGKIVERGYNNLTFSEAIGMPIATYNRRIASDGVDFTIGEVETIVEKLSLSANEASEIFLPL